MNYLIAKLARNLDVTCQMNYIASKFSLALDCGGDQRWQLAYLIWLRCVSHCDFIYKNWDLKINCRKLIVWNWVFKKIIILKRRKSVFANYMQNWFVFENSLF